ncbi:hypothetical protein [Streptomyces sp. WMMC940]|uniref:hypothetical protein n=1 Tax=Streptomyces sp. WMMC940 TaxID=3015153 RepID=UPI0022B6C07E|nr:hypothetical protein [Streptomyces sp. WMMC940]MCZ7456904.1 hypothetical protein [Streptomyces sp. WMMC940]
MTAGWCSRTVRAAVFAAVCVLLAALGHVMMSGEPMPWWTPAGGFVATGALGWGLAGRERGLPSVVAVVVAVQTALHTVFSLAQSGTGAADHTARAAAPVHQGHHHTGSSGMGQAHTDATHGMAMGHGHGASLESAGHMGSAHTPLMGDMIDMDRTSHLHHLDVLSGDSSSWGMLAAHLLAALLTGLWLAYGERAAFRILRAVAGWLTAPLRLLLALPAPPRRPRLRGRRRPSRASRLLPLVYAIVSRGPPVGSAVA